MRACRPGVWPAVGSSRVEWPCAKPASFVLSMEGTPICAARGSRVYFEDASLRHRPLGLSRLGSAAIGSDRRIICSRGASAGPPGKLTRSVNCPSARVIAVAFPE
jgi:hypothetical protein